MYPYARINYNENLMHVAWPIDQLLPPCKQWAKVNTKLVYLHTSYSLHCAFATSGIFWITLRCSILSTWGGVIVTI